MPVYFACGVYCLAQANWQPRKWLIPGTMTEISIERGQFITGRESLYQDLYGPGKWQPSAKGG